MLSAVSFRMQNYYTNEKDYGIRRFRFFRNHGFLLTPKGWTLSPAYDINPGAKTHQCLLIDQYTEQSDVNALLHASGSYMLERQEAFEIIEEVRAAIKDWRMTATGLQVSHKLLESYCNRWDKL